MSSLVYIAKKVAVFPTPAEIINISPDPLSTLSPRDLTTKPVGSLPGRINIGSNGAASYSIPLITPPGTAGMQPNISINYNSSAGIGLLGKGWDLTATSVITRSGNNFYLDGKKDGINFDSNDKYELDGNRLISINGTYGNDGTEYRTENETFSKINSVGVINNLGYFIVETKDGRTMEYGRTLDSRLELQSQNKVMVWYLNKVTDKFGNYIKYNYFKNTNSGETLLTSIEYTGNDTNSLLPYNEVIFGYTTKNDSNTAYLKGSIITKSALLVNIVILNENTMVKQYHFDYNFNNNNAMRLVEISESASNGSAYNSTIINWGIKPTSYSIVTTNERPLPQGLKEIYGDFNGDGHLDWIQGNYLYLSDQSGNNFTKVQVSLGSGSNIEYKVGDFNGDGLDDLLECFVNVTSTYTPLFSTGTGFIKNESGQFILPNISEVVVGDFDGDGLIDIFAKEIDETKEYKNWKIYSCTNADHNAFQLKYSGNDFPNKMDSSTYEAVYNADGSIAYYKYTYWHQIYSEFNKQFIDFDGDGKTDLMCFEPGGTSFYKFDGTHFVKAFTTTDLTDINNLKSMGDFNGDGNIDMLITGSPYKIIYNTGSGTVIRDVPNMPLNASVLGTGDFNGDGKSDILYVTNVSHLI